MNPIIREWRGRVPRDRADAYLEVLRETGLKQYAATPGHRGTLVLRSDADKESEYLLLTFWASADAVAAFAGPDINRAVYYPEDEPYLIEKPANLRHYQVAEVAGPAIDARGLAGRSGAWPPIAGWR